MKKISIFILMAMLLPSIVMAANQYATVYNPLTLHRKVVEVGTDGAFMNGYKLETKDVYDERFGNLLGIKPIRPSGYETSLSSSLAEGGAETTLVVNSLDLPDGTTVTDDNYGDLLILTVGEGDSEEKIAVGALDESTLTFTIISRGLEYGKWASSTSNINQHLPGERVYVSNDDHHLYQQFYSLDGDETATGDSTFSGNLTFTGSNDFTGGTITVPTPTAGTNPATKDYADGLAFAGVGTSTTETAGGGFLTTREDIANSAYDSDSPRFLYSGVATTTRDTATTSIVATNESGYIEQELIDLSEDFSFSGTSTFSGAVYGVLTPFGDGSDGASTTAGNFTMTRDMYFSNLTINNGITLDPNGFKIFVTGTITTTGTGKIANNGGNGGNGTAGGLGTGAGGSAGAIANTAGTLPASLAGVSGGNGGSLGSAGSAGGNGVNSAKSITAINAVAGGAGQAGSSSSAGAGGTAGQTTGTIYNTLNNYINAYNLFDLSGTTITQFGVNPSSGGGGGGGSNSGANSDLKGSGGGGSGASGGIIWVSAKNISTLNIEATGGNGGDGATEQADGGGGAGGNGGVIILIYRSSTGLVTDVSGGTGGTGATAGADGNDGIVYQLNI